jgi:hypothetical protein
MSEPGVEAVRTERVLDLNPDELAVLSRHQRAVQQAEAVVGVVVEAFLAARGLRRAQVLRVENGSIVIAEPDGKVVGSISPPAAAQT